MATRDVEGCEHLLDLLLLLVHYGVEKLIDRVQTELAEGPLEALARLGWVRHFDPLLAFGVEERVTLQTPHHLSLVHAELGSIHLCELRQCECP